MISSSFSDVLDKFFLTVSVEDNGFSMVGFRPKRSRDGRNLDIRRHGVPGHFRLSSFADIPRGRVAAYSFPPSLSTTEIIPRCCVVRMSRMSITRDTRALPVDFRTPI